MAKKMNPQLRRKFILDILNEKEFITIEEVVARCHVSEITIRRDLIEMESEGLLVRTQGGATRSKVNNHLFSFDVKINQNWQRKEQICQIAADYISNNDIIFIDCGTTLFHLTKYIRRFESLVVITNSLPVVSELCDSPNIRLILIGGEVAGERKAIYGLQASKNIDQYHANKAFIGADGVSLTGGLSSYHEKEASITLKMANNADEVFLVCDSSKIERNSFVKFAPFSIVDHLITNNDMDPQHLEEYRDAGIHVIIE
ncbi:MAG TPA: DeoR/GlpR transcriptional regulator [Bacteroidales bacterium]|jgi:DeoR family fructose operon transcriptional repressor|nr:DeoR/GlpR transcriptional regulator [Bacteroidales bacterium]